MNRLVVLTFDADIWTRIAELTRGEAILRAKILVQSAGREGFPPRSVALRESEWRDVVRTIRSTNEADADDVARRVWRTVQLETRGPLSVVEARRRPGDFEEVDFT